ncbi:MAG: type IV pilus assembly protein PilM [Thermodesulfobacteriota bacterium]
MEIPFLSGKKDAVALDIGSNAIKVVQLNQAKKGWELKKLGIAYLPPEAIVDGSVIDSMTVTNTITELIKEQGIKAVDAASALTGHSVIIKKVSLPAMTEEELGESVQWEAEQYIPFPMSDVNIDFQILGEDTEGRGQMDVMLVAVKKDVINDYTNVIKEAGLNPVVVDVDCFALENMIEINYSMAPEENLAVVNIGASITSISVISGGITVFTRSVPMGGNQFTEEIQRHFNISFSDAEDLKMGKEVSGVDAEELPGVIAAVSGNMALEVRRSVDFFMGGAPGAMVSKVLLGGGGARVKDLSAVVQERTAVPVEMVDPFNGLICNPKRFDPDYLSEMAPYFGVAVGLGTRRFGDR